MLLFLSLHTSSLRRGLVINLFLQLFRCKAAIINCFFCFTKQIHCSIWNIPKYNKRCTVDIDGLKDSISVPTDAIEDLKEILCKF